MELAPGEETTLHFDLDFRTRKGPQRFTCRLVEASGEEWVYVLETTLYERAGFEGTGAVHFGMIDPNAVATRSTHYVLHGETAAKVARAVTFRSDAKSLRVTKGSEKVEKLADGTFARTIPVELHLRAPDAAGFGQASVSAVGGSDEPRHHQTAVTWSVRSTYAVSPAQVYFGVIDPAKIGATRVRISIRRVDARPLEIKRVSVPSPLLRSTIEKADDVATASIQIELDGNRLQGPLWGEAIIETNHQHQPVLRIPLAALLKSKNG